MFFASEGFDIEEITAIRELFHHTFGQKILFRQKSLSTSKIRAFNDLSLKISGLPQFFVSAQSIFYHIFV